MCTSQQNVDSDRHPVILARGPVEVLDLTGPPDARPPPASDWTIGRYDEDRRGMYTQPLFAAARTVHMGIDLGGPVGTPVHAWAAGEVVCVGYNPRDGDYGHVLVLEHDVVGHPRFCLYGHLSSSVLGHARPGRRFATGDVIAWLGAPHENGGWPPHAHVQLSWERPLTHDLPGAVAPRDRAEALRLYPDPRRVLGPLY